LFLYIQGGGHSHDPIAIPDHIHAANYKSEKRKSIQSYLSQFFNENKNNNEEKKIHYQYNLDELNYFNKTGEFTYKNIEYHYIKLQSKYNNSLNFKITSQGKTILFIFEENKNEIIIKPIKTLLGHFKEFCNGFSCSRDNGNVLDPTNNHDNQ
jgi:hypothetical protein